MILLALPKRSAVPANKSCSHPLVTTIITVHSEAARIEQNIRNTLVLQYLIERREIFVASDTPTNPIDEVVLGYEKDGVRLIRSDSREGKEYAQLLAIGAARADIPIFTDVGTSIPPEGGIRLLRPKSLPRRAKIVLSHKTAAPLARAYTSDMRCGSV